MVRLGLYMALAGALVAGCGGARTTAAQPAVAGDPGYPAGPYGYAAGDVLPDLQFDGKSLATGEQFESSDWQTSSLGSLRTDGVRLLVIEAAAGWCSDCAGDQPVMMRLESDYRPQGVVGLEVLVEGAYGVAATRSDLDGWAVQHDLSGPLLVDDGGRFERAADIEAFPTYFVVDARTMKIVVRQSDTLIASPLGPTLDSLLAQP